MYIHVFDTQLEKYTSVKTTRQRKKNNAKMIIDRLSPFTHSQALDSVLNSVTTFN